MTKLPRSFWLLMLLLLSPPALASVTTYYPVPTDTYDYYLGYPYMGVAGDTVIGQREATGLPAVNQVRFYTVVDQTQHWACFPDLLFYYNGEYLGFVELEWWNSYTTIDATLNVTLSNAAQHEITIELQDTIYSWGCLASWIEILDNQSFIEMDLVGADVDGDGYYATAYYGDDCDDGNAAVNPGAAETCNGIDDNCSGTIDEGVQTTWYLDTDGDGYGQSGSSTLACTAPTGYVSASGDCDDGDIAIYPSAPEACNGIDDDCDGNVDEGVTSTYYLDSDGDGYGVNTSSTQACAKPTGYATVAGDCDNGDDTVYPSASELCDGKDNDCDGSTDEGVTTTYYLDNDGDGYGQTSATSAACSRPTGYASVAGDCDDGSSAVNPGASEACNGIDDDCDGATDEGVTATYYGDGDGDGYGVASDPTVACTKPTGYATVSGDCDDTDASVYPSAPELCDGQDNDCDGSVDENVTTTYYLDNDADGYGQTGATSAACAKPSGYAAIGGDCDDSVAAVNPGATEACNGLDDDCDGGVDEGLSETWYADADGDGFGVGSNSLQDCAQPAGYASAAGDCDDTDPSVYPNAGEQCDGKDNDCDGAIDEAVQTVWYLDNDGDGFGQTGTTAETCSQPTGYAGDGGDCDDGDSSINPGASEFCNGIDDDCDGAVDEGQKTTYYQDNDGDGYGSATTTDACALPDGFATQSGDCDDTSDTVYPSATEQCDGLDNDCDGSIDEGVQTTWYGDADGDGYGLSSTTTLACDRPEGYASTAGDCDDGDPAVNPAASEACNGLDDDCDGAVDENQKTTFYRDSDADGYGVSGVTQEACSQPDGYASQAGDCDDSDDAVYPDAPEQCDGKDNDCDGAMDEGVQNTYYADGDGDGYGLGTVSLLACTAPEGYTGDPGDCDDSDATINPGASELCNGLDDDCDGATDEGVTSTWYADGDQDGYGDPVRSADACTAPSGYVDNGEDCNDADPNSNPGAPETCDGRDNDCDGATDEGVQNTYFADQDGDGYGDGESSLEACERPAGYATNQTDCDDGDATVNPGASESCNGLDDDCNGVVDDGVETRFYLDADQDGYGDEDSTLLACTRPDGYVDNGEDCDDTNPALHPDAVEVCNGLDDNCDGTVDEGVETNFYRDLDQDGYGDPSSVDSACEAAEGYVANDLDCDDTNADIHPAAEDICEDDIDQNCDGYDLGCDVVDGDGDGLSPADGDCNDQDAASYPGADELCDGVDNDCNSVIDDLDLDEDGAIASACGGDDCNDDDASVNPAAEEICDGLDNDCDSLVDNVDADGDGSLDGACSGDDCDDQDASVHPGATETCDARDNDCDGVIDNQDEDGDGYIAAFCDGDDCNDQDAEIHPDALEVQNGVDDNCDGFIDEGSSVFDDDGDGYTEDLGDCDDADPEVYPGAEDLPGDGIDQDCDGEDASVNDTPSDDTTPVDSTPGDDTPLGDDDTTSEETPAGDDDTSGATPTGDDDDTLDSTPSGDDDTDAGDDDDTDAGDDDTGDDDTLGDDDAGDDDTDGEDDTPSDPGDSGQDAVSSPTPSSMQLEGTGCNCRIPGSQQPAGSAWLLLLLGGTLWGIRRRRLHRD